MPTLNSPGVQVTVVDESFYDNSTTGSIPLIILATAENKVSPSGAGISPQTTKNNAGNLFIATSQRELIQSFGNPLFYTSGGNSLHGHELNEYGLHAAYQFLGQSNRAFILRADIDLAQLLPSDTAPTSPPVSGTFWLNTANTRFGLFKSNGKPISGEAWVSQPVSVFNNSQTEDVGGVFTPLGSIGANGDFGVVVHTTQNFFFEKINNTWFRVGSAEWKAATPTVITGTVSSPTVTIGNTIIINGETVTFTTATITSVAQAINDANIDSIEASLNNNALLITNTSGGDIIITNGSGTGINDLGLIEGTFSGGDLYYTNGVAYPEGSNSGDVWIKGSPSNNGASWALNVYNATTGSWNDVSVPFYEFDSTVVDSPEKDAGALASIPNISVGQVYAGYDVNTGVTTLRRFNNSGVFEDLSYQAGSTVPFSTATEGTKWFSDNFRTDIMVSDGTKWRAYKNFYPATSPNGVIISGSAPLSQSDGTPLVDNDLWLDSSAGEEYPLLRRFNTTTQRWGLVDSTDQTSPFGVMFADARQDSGVAFTGQITDNYSYLSEATSDMLVSDFVDPDAPDPRTVPSGMMLFNTRYSTNNVKEWRPDWFGYGGYDENVDFSLTTYTVGDSTFSFPALTNKGRWTTISGNRSDGSPLMGRRAQRAVVARAMGEAINASNDARSEFVSFNLIAAPGYPELIDEMTTLNSDQGETAFVVGDTPIRLKSDSNSLNEWATNAYGATTNGEDGLLTANEYVGIYYPWGISSNIDGSEVMVPPSTMALRTIAYNDQVAYPWFSPAGFRRGLVSNASNVGYLDDENEFKPVLLSVNQRDTLASNNINAIAFIQNRGLVVYTQKTRAATTTSLDRINVARLINYLRVSLENITTPFLHEPNDEQTRDSARLIVERFLSGIQGLRGIDDFAVLVSEDNNTPDRVSRSELWIDIAIRPVKAVEFIYIPVRVVDNDIDG